MKARSNTIVRLDWYHRLVSRTILDFQARNSMNIMALILELSSLCVQCILPQLLSACSVFPRS